MKIADSNISMQAFSRSTQTVFQSQTSKLTVRVGTAQSQAKASAQSRQDKIDLSERARKLSRALKKQNDARTNQTATDDDLRDMGYSEKDINVIHLLERMTEELTGRKFKLNIPVFNRPSSPGTTAAAAHTGQSGSGSFVQIRLETQTLRETVETQSLDFQARGTVTTADGKSIDLSVSLNMSREFASKAETAADTTISFGGNACDPLAVNFAGTAPELDERSIRFDLDCDGTSDQIAFLKQGSGFLALDKNGDGIVNDGGELFGPQSGNGFADLAVYDSDGNNWIDENDAVYDKLRVWTVDDAGNRTLLALGQVGVGVIYLGNVRGDFSINDSANQTLGNIRSTGIFLKEDGGAGTVQHIDLAI